MAYKQALDTLGLGQYRMLEGDQPEEPTAEKLEFSVEEKAILESLRHSEGIAEAGAQPGTDAGIMKYPRELHRATKRSLYSTARLFTGAAALGGAAVGLEGVEKWGLKSSKMLQEAEKIAVPPAKVQKFTDIRFREGAKGLDDVAMYALNTIGEQSTVLLDMVVSAGIGAAVGGATAGPPGSVAMATAGIFARKTLKGMIRRKVAEKMARLTASGALKNPAIKSGLQGRLLRVATKEVMDTKNLHKLVPKMIGAKVGVVAGMWPLEAGGNYLEAVEAGYQGRSAALKAALTGLLASGVEIIGGSGRFINMILNPTKAAARGFKPFFMRLARNFGQQVPEEFAQEATQEFLSMVNMKLNDPDVSLFDKEALLRYLNSGMAGATVGGFLGGAGAVTQTFAGGRPIDSNTPVNLKVGAQGPFERLSQRPDGPAPTDGPTPLGGAGDSVDMSMQGFMDELKGIVSALPTDPRAEPDIEAEKLDQQLAGLEELSGAAAALESSAIPPVTSVKAAAKPKKAKPTEKVITPEEKKATATAKLKAISDKLEAKQKGKGKKKEEQTEAFRMSVISGALDSIEKAKEDGRTDKEAESLYKSYRKTYLPLVNKVLKEVDAIEKLKALKKKGEEIIAKKKAEETAALKAKNDAMEEQEVDKRAAAVSADSRAIIGAALSAIDKAREEGRTDAAAEDTLKKYRNVLSDKVLKNKVYDKVLSEIEKAAPKEIPTKLDKAEKADPTVLGSASNILGILGKKITKTGKDPSTTGMGLGNLGDFSEDETKQLKQEFSNMWTATKKNYANIEEFIKDLIKRFGSGIKAVADVWKGEQSAAAAQPDKEPYEMSLDAFKKTGGDEAAFKKNVEAAIAQGLITTHPDLPNIVKGRGKTVAEKKPEDLGMDVSDSWADKYRTTSVKEKATESADWVGTNITAGSEGRPKVGDKAYGPDHVLHNTRLTPTVVKSIFGKEGLQSREAPGGQPKLLFAHTTGEQAGIVNNRPYGKPLSASRDKNAVTVLIRNKGQFIGGRGGAAGSVTSRIDIKPEDIYIIDPESYGGKPLGDAIKSLIPEGRLVDMDVLKSKDGKLSIIRPKKKSPYIGEHIRGAAEAWGKTQGAAEPEKPKGKLTAEGTFRMKKAELKKYGNMPEVQAELARRKALGKPPTKQPVKKKVAKKPAVRRAEAKPSGIDEKLFRMKTAELNAYKEIDLVRANKEIARRLVGRKPKTKTATADEIFRMKGAQLKEYAKTDKVAAEIEQARRQAKLNNERKAKGLPPIKKSKVKTFSEPVSAIPPGTPDIEEVVESRHVSAEMPEEEAGAEVQETRGWQEEVQSRVKVARKPGPRVETPKRRSRVIEWKAGIGWTVAVKGVGHKGDVYKYGVVKRNTKVTLGTNQVLVPKAGYKEMVNWLATNAVPAPKASADIAADLKKIKTKPAVDANNLSKVELAKVLSLKSSKSLDRLSPEQYEKAIQAAQLILDGQAVAESIQEDVGGAIDETAAEADAASPKAKAGQRWRIRQVLIKLAKRYIASRAKPVKAETPSDARKMVSLHISNARASNSFDEFIAQAIELEEKYPSLINPVDKIFRQMYGDNYRDRDFLYKEMRETSDRVLMSELDASQHDRLDKALHILLNIEDHSNTLIRTAESVVRVYHKRMVDSKRGLPGELTEVTESMTHPAEFKRLAELEKAIPKTHKEKKKAAGERISKKLKAAAASTKRNLDKLFPGIKGTTGGFNRGIPERPLFPSPAELKGIYDELTRGFLEIPELVRDIGDYGKEMLLQMAQATDERIRFYRDKIITGWSAQRLMGAAEPKPDKAKLRQQLHSLFKKPEESVAPSQQVVQGAGVLDLANVAAYSTYEVTTSGEYLSKTIPGAAIAGRGITGTLIVRKSDGLIMAGLNKDVAYLADGQRKITDLREDKNMVKGFRVIQKTGQAPDISGSEVFVHSSWGGDQGGKRGKVIEGGTGKGFADWTPTIGNWTVVLSEWSRDTVRVRRSTKEGTQIGYVRGMHQTYVLQNATTGEFIEGPPGEEIPPPELPPLNERSVGPDYGFVILPDPSSWTGIAGKEKQIEELEDKPVDFIYQGSFFYDAWKSMMDAIAIHKAPRVKPTYKRTKLKFHSAESAAQYAQFLADGKIEEEDILLVDPKSLGRTEATDKPLSTTFFQPTDKPPKLVRPAKDEIPAGIDNYDIIVGIQELALDTTLNEQEYYDKVSDLIRPLEKVPGGIDNIFDLVEAEFGTRDLMAARENAATSRSGKKNLFSVANILGFHLRNFFRGKSDRVKPYNSLRAVLEPAEPGNSKANADYLLELYANRTKKVWYDEETGTESSVQESILDLYKDPVYNQFVDRGPKVKGQGLSEAKAALKEEGVPTSGPLPKAKVETREERKARELSELSEEKAKGMAFRDAQKKEWLRQKAEMAGPVLRLAEAEEFFEFVERYAKRHEMEWNKAKFYKLDNIPEAKAKIHALVKKLTDGKIKSSSMPYHLRKKFLGMTEKDKYDSLNEIMPEVLQQVSDLIDTLTLEESPLGKAQNYLDTQESKLKENPDPGRLTHDMSEALGPVLVDEVEENLLSRNFTQEQLDDIPYTILKYLDKNNMKPSDWERIREDSGRIAQIIDEAGDDTTEMDEETGEPSFKTVTAAEADRMIRELGEAETQELLKEIRDEAQRIVGDVPILTSTTDKLYKRWQTYKGSKVLPKSLRLDKVVGMHTSHKDFLNKHLRSYIRLAMDYRTAAGLKDTAAHEIGHALHSLAIVTAKTQAEAEMLSGVSKESFANRFARHKAYKERQQKVSPTKLDVFHTAFDRIIKFLDQLGDYLRGRGFNTVEDIFKEGDKGNILKMYQQMDKNQRAMGLHRLADADSQFSIESMNSFIKHVPSIFRNRKEDKDLSKTRRQIATVMGLGNRFPNFKRLQGMAMDMAGDVNEFIDMISRDPRNPKDPDSRNAFFLLDGKKEIDVFDKLHRYSDNNKVLLDRTKRTQSYRQQKNGKWVHHKEHESFDSMLDKAGVTDEASRQRIYDAYRDWKRAFDKALDRYHADTKDILMRTYEHKEWFSDLFNYVKRAESLAQQADGLVVAAAGIKDQKHQKDIMRAGARLLGYRKTLSDLRTETKKYNPFYAPRIREEGKWKVIAKKKVGKNTIYTHQKMFGWKWQAQMEVSRLEEKGGYGEISYDVYKEPRTVYGGIPANMVEDMMATYTEQLRETQDFTDTMIENLHTAILDQAVKGFKIKDFGGHLTERMDEQNQGVVITGFTEGDPHHEFMSYMRSLIGRTSKMKFALDARRLLKEVQSSKEFITGKNREEYDALSTYSQDMIKSTVEQDRLFNRFKSTAFVWYIAGNPKSAFIQLTQNVLLGTPRMARMLKETGLSKTKWSLQAENRFRKSALDVAKGWFSKGPNKYMSPEEREDMQRRVERGALIAFNTNFLMGEYGQKFGAKMRKFFDILAWPFARAEIFNRKLTWLAFYRAYTELGLDRHDASLKAEEDMLHIHFIYGKANLPEKARGSGPFGTLARTAMTFRSYNHNYVQEMFDSTKVGEVMKDPGSGKEITVNRWAFDVMARSMAYMALMGGMAAMPFLDDILEIFEKVSGTPYRANMRAVMDVYGGEMVGRVGTSGILSLAMGDLSGSLEIGIPFTDGVDRALFGVYGGMEEKLSRAFQAWYGGQVMRGFEEMSPQMLTNPLRAIREARFGGTKVSGKPLMLPTGEKYKPSVLDTARQFAGFRPPSRGDLTRKQRSLYNVEKSFKRRRDNIYTKLRVARLHGNRAALMKLGQDIADFNKDASRLEGTVSFITKRSIKSAVPNRVKKQFVKFEEYLKRVGAR